MTARERAEACLSALFGAEHREEKFVDLVEAAIAAHAREAARAAAEAMRSRCEARAAKWSKDAALDIRRAPLPGDA